MNNKEKNTRVVVFKEDYISAASKAELGKDAKPIYRKGETAAIHKDMVSKLEAKGAKMDVKKLDKEPIVKRRKKMLSENKKKAYAVD